jgi:hypothetical protein
MTDQNPTNDEHVWNPNVPSRGHVPLPVSSDTVDTGLGRWVWLCVAAAVILAAVVWVWGLHGTMTRLERRLSAPALRQDVGERVEQQQQILSFETRLARILGSSVESKLRTLERSVERGPLTAEELRLLESTASELRLLQANPAVAAGLAVEQKDHPRYNSVVASTSPSSLIDDGLSDIAELRKMYYSALICLALAGMFGAGFWYRQRRRYRLAQMTPRHQLPVLKHYQEDRGH